MTSIQHLRPGQPPDRHCPTLPPLPIGALAVGVANLLQDAAQLPAAPLRRVVRSRADQRPVRPGQARACKAITRWARRFGGVVTTETRQGQTGPETWCSAKFSYYGVSVKAYARIPAAPASN